MERLLPFAIALLAALPALAGDGGVDAGAGAGADEAESEASLGALEGRVVTRVSAPGAPAGFDPVADAAVPLGARLDRDLVAAAASRLARTSNYRTVRIGARPGPAQGAELTIFVEPVLRVQKLAITGNRALDDEEVARAIGHVPDRAIVADQGVLEGYRGKLLVAYAGRGYKEARASLRLETTSLPGAVVLAIDVQEGEPERYADVAIKGLPRGLSGSALARQAGLGPGAVRDKAAVEESGRSLSRALGELGYLDARVERLDEAKTGPREYALTLVVRCGARTTIVFRGNRHLRRGELLETLVGSGDFRTAPDSLEQGLGRVRNLYRRSGFFHARVEAARLCRADDGRTIAADAACPAGWGEQRLTLTIEEGPQVEVAGLVFRGNAFLDGARLEKEVFAYMEEKLARPGIFDPVDTASVDDLGLSDPRPRPLGKPRGARAPSFNTQRIYVPETYRSAMEHLASVYQEAGFLSATVTDTCRPGETGRMAHGGETFTPLLVARQGDPRPRAGERAMGPCVLVNARRDELLVVITIDEGPRTLVGEIAFEGNDVLASRRLENAAGVALMDAYNEYKLQEATRRILEEYRSRGYMFATVSWSKSVSPDMQRARVLFTLNEGPQVRAGRIVAVRGAVSTSHRLVRERVSLDEGDLVTPQAIEESQDRLMDLGIFEGATVQMVAPEEPAGVKDVIVTVKESKPQYLELRGGMATVEGVRGGFEYGYRNLGGWGLGARLRARANYRLFFVGNPEFQRRFDAMPLVDQIEYHLLLGVAAPHIPGIGRYLGTAVDGTMEQVNEPAFSANRITGFFHLTSSYVRHVTLDARTGVENTDITLPGVEGSLATNPEFLTWARMPKGKSTFWVTGLVVTLNLRDDNFNPSRGIFVSIGADLVRSLANFAPEKRDVAVLDPVTGQESTQTVLVDKVSNLVRAEGTVSGYVPLIGKKMVLALSLSAGYIFHLQSDSTTWADRYFYMGGVESLRGFPEESLVPEDLYQAWKKTLDDSSDEANALLKSTGGEAMLLARAEFRFPLAKGFSGALFTEAGNLWRDRTLVEPFKLRPVTGLGVRYTTPIGPVAFDVGINLAQRPHEEPAWWHLSIGTAF
jgi:outer membrane protein insertion porin family